MDEMEVNVMVNIHEDLVNMQYIHIPCLHGP